MTIKRLLWLVVVGFLLALVIPVKSVAAKTTYLSLSPREYLQTRQKVTVTNSYYKKGQNHPS